MSRTANVVVRRPFEKLSSCNLMHEIEIGVDSNVLWMSKIANSLVSLRELFADLLRTVSGSIVSNDQFEVRKGLSE
jgi:hypothetical protein